MCIHIEKVNNSVFVLKDRPGTALCTAVELTWRFCPLCAKPFDRHQELRKTL